MEFASLDSLIESERQPFCPDRLLKQLPSKIVDPVQRQKIKSAELNKREGDLASSSRDRKE